MGEFGSFDGRGVFTTGASSGNGRLLALHVAKEGGKVELVARPGTVRALGPVRDAEMGEHLGDSARVEGQGAVS